MPINVDGSIITDQIIREYEFDSIIKNGLIFYLDASIFNTISGNTWYDLSGNGNHFTLFNSPSFVNTNGGSLVFNTTNNHARSTTTLDLSSYSSITVEVSFFVPTVTSNVMVFEHTTDWNSQAGAFGALTNSNGGNASSPTTDNDIHTNGSFGRTDYNIPNITVPSIYHFTFESGQGGNLFYNTNQATEIGTSTVNTSNSSNSNFYIGTRAGTEAFGDLTLYYIRLYNRVLSSSEISHNYNVNKHRFGL